MHRELIRSAAGRCRRDIKSRKSTHGINFGALVPRCHIIQENCKNKDKMIYQKCALLGYYVASSGNFLTTFLVKVSVPSSGF